MTEEHHHHEVEALQTKVSAIAVDVGIIKAAVSGENGIPARMRGHDERLRTLESWRGRVSGQTVLLAGLLAAAIGLGGAIISRL